METASCAKYSCINILRQQATYRRIQTSSPSALGKESGRGGETWKDGLSDTFNSESKEQILVGKNLRKTHDGEKYQFLNVDLALSAGQRIAVVGPNGSGKSTLLQVIAGKYAGEDGDLWIRKGLRVAFLEQEPAFDESLEVLQAVYARDTPTMRTLRRYDAAVNGIETAVGEQETLSATSELTAALEAMDLMSAWDLESKAKSTLDRLGCDEFLMRKMGELSGGQKKRVALAAALIEEPELLILDEPTNHLSIEGVEWLEQTLSSMGSTAVVLVSHDRRFIDAVCPDIIELDGFGGAHMHRGGYAAYVEAREARWAAEAQNRAAAKNTLRKEKEWMRRQPKARATKEKARIERFYSLSYRVAKSGTKGTRVDLVEAKVSRMGDFVAEFDKASLAFGEKIILDEFSYAFSKREKIGLVGPNGAGKTTFLKALMCEIPLDSGWVSVGETIQFGYYSQVATFDDKADLKVADYVKAIEGEARSVVGGFGGLLKGVSAYKLLERFNFSGPRQMTSISQLSGGEKRRLQLLSVMALAPNFLILDEPTNDLDLDTIEALEDMLFDFDGCVLVVSHDRAFVNNLVDHIFVFDGQGNVNDWYGDYDSLRRHLKKNTYIPSVSDVDIKTAKEREALIAKEEVERAILKEAYNAPSVVQKIERALAVLDEAVAAIDVKLIHCGSDANAAHEVQKERDLKVAKQDTYYAEWERLERIMAEAEEIKAAREAI